MRVIHIHFGQGDEARSLVDTLTNTEGVLVRGVTEESANAVVEALRDLDSGSDEYATITTLDEINPGEDRVEWGGYVITYHTGLGYLSFDRKV